MREDLQKYFQFSPFFVDSKSMSDLDWEKFQDKIDKMPPPLYNLLVDDKTSRFIEALIQKYIQINTRGPEIARIIRDVILADIYIGDMPAQISSKLGVDQNTALEIARAIVSQLFAPVIEDIKKLQLQKFGKLPGSSTPQSSPQRPLQHIPGEDLPETGGNIIDLRSKS
jgi:hypothetical protein